MCTVHNQSGNGTKKADIHNQEHERWSRRSFLQALGLAGAGSILLGNADVTASSPSKLTQAISNADTDRILVLMRLKGGNDGLNTIIPIYDFDTYANNRPTIHYKEKELYKLNDDFGIPPAMKELEGLWGEGAMKVVHGVGYKGQDLSHFKSSNIWASTDLTEVEDSGFLGRYYEGLHPDFLLNPPEIPAAIQIGSVGNLIFDGKGVSNYALTVSNPQELERLGETGKKHSLTDLPDCTYGDRLAYLRSVTNNTFNYAKTIFDAYNKASNTVEYSKEGIGRQLAIVARMIKGDLGTKVYMVSVDGFDTHANQTERHTELWEEVSKNVKLFYEDLKASEKDKEVLTMSISEFGRRVEENGSNGTDHGQAAPILFFGPALEENGFIGEHPDLNDLDPIGNLKYKTDFREIYATVLKEWMCIDNGIVDEVLLDSTLKTKDLGFSCKQVGEVVEEEEDSGGVKGGVVENEEGIIQEEVINLNEVKRAKVEVYQKNQDTIIKLIQSETNQVDISLFSITGKRVATIKNGILASGEYEFNLSTSIAFSGAVQGLYIYRIVTGTRAFSGKIMLE